MKLVVIQTTFGSKELPTRYLHVWMKIEPFDSEFKDLYIHMIDDLLVIYSFVQIELCLLNLCRRTEVSKMHLKSNFLSLCKPLRNESSIIVFLT